MFLLIAIGAVTLAAPQDTVTESVRESVAAKVRALIVEYDAAHRVWYQEYLGSQGSEEVMKRIPDTAQYGREMLAIAAEAPKGDGAFQACAWVVANVHLGETRKAAIGHVTGHLLGHPEVGGLIEPIVTGEESSDAFLLWVLEHPPSDELAARACYVLASNRKNRLSGIRSPEEAARVEAEAAEYFALCQAEPFASVELQGDVTIGAQARADLFEMKHLCPGKVAPEIAGEDIDGVPFKLGDYRGQVVMLSFWGHW